MLHNSNSNVASYAMDELILKMICMTDDVSNEDAFKSVTATAGILCVLFY